MSTAIPVVDWSDVRGRLTEAGKALEIADSEIERISATSGRSAGGRRP